MGLWDRYWLETIVGRQTSDIYYTYTNNRGNGFSYDGAGNLTDDMGQQFNARLSLTHGARTQIARATRHFRRKSLRATNATRTAAMRQYFVATIAGTRVSTNPTLTTAPMTLLLILTISEGQKALQTLRNEDFKTAVAD